MKVELKLAYDAGESSFSVGNSSVGFGSFLVVSFTGLRNMEVCCFYMGKRFV